MAEAVGVVAGAGSFPVEVARGARRQGHRVVGFGVAGLCHPDFEGCVDDYQRFEAGQLAALLAALQASGVSQLVLAGKVPKALLYASGAVAGIDSRAGELLASLPDRKDDSLLGRIVDTLGAAGIHVRDQACWTPELLASPGVLTRCAPGDEAHADLCFGWPMAKAIGKLDLGQTVVVCRGAVVAVEAIEGTDEAIARGGSLVAGDRPSGGGAPRNAVRVIKVAKPQQDMRFDVPAVGPGTVSAIEAVGGDALAIEAGRTLLLEREELLLRADRAGISIVAFPESGPQVGGR